MRSTDLKRCWQGPGRLSGHTFRRPCLLQHVRERWSIENSWHWPRDTQLREDAHRYREVNGVQILATLRSLAMNALRLAGFWSITEGLAALAHDIPGMLALLGWRKPAQALSSA